MELFATLQVDLFLGSKFAYVQKTNNIPLGITLQGKICNNIKFGFQNQDIKVTSRSRWIWARMEWFFPCVRPVPVLCIVALTRFLFDDSFGITAELVQNLVWTMCQVLMASAEVWHSWRLCHVRGCLKDWSGSASHLGERKILGIKAGASRRRASRCPWQGQRCTWRVDPQTPIQSILSYSENHEALWRLMQYDPALPKDMENQHVRVRDMIYSKFMRCSNSGTMRGSILNRVPCIQGHTYPCSTVWWWGTLYKLKWIHWKGSLPHSQFPLWSPKLTRTSRFLVFAIRESLMVVVWVTFVSVTNPRVEITSLGHQKNPSKNMWARKKTLVV